jgi:hypothetical protein
MKDSTWNDALGKPARHEATLMNAFTRLLLLLQNNRATRRVNRLCLRLLHFRLQLDGACNSRLVNR